MRLQVSGRAQFEDSAPEAGNHPEIRKFTPHPADQLFAVRQFVERVEEEDVPLQDAVPPIRMDVYAVARNFVEHSFVRQRLHCALHDEQGDSGRRRQVAGHRQFFARGNLAGFQQIEDLVPYDGQFVRLHIDLAVY